MRKQPDRLGVIASTLIALGIALVLEVREVLRVSGSGGTRPMGLPGEHGLVNLMNVHLWTLVATVGVSGLLCLLCCAALANRPIQATRLAAACGILIATLFASLPVDWLQYYVNRPSDGWYLGVPAVHRWAPVAAVYGGVASFLIERVWTSRSNRKAA